MRRAGLFIVTRSFLTRPYSPRATLEGRPTVSEPPAFGFMGTGFSDTVEHVPNFSIEFLSRNPSDRSAKRTRTSRWSLPGHPGSGHSSTSPCLFIDPRSQNGCRFLIPCVTPHSLYKSRFVALHRVRYSSSSDEMEYFISRCGSSKRFCSKRCSSQKNV